MVDEMEDQLALGDDEASVNVIKLSPTRLSADAIAAALRSGRCLRDSVFDRFLPDDLQIVSHQHWTPLAVALRVAEWLDLAGVRHVVDLGSGAGKFCVAAALASQCSFIGIEQRPRLVEAARALARRFGVEDRVQFVEGTLDPDSIPSADAYYLYNPFGENLFGADDHLDDDVELNFERYERDVEVVQRFLEQAPRGTYVIKYNGFGGRMPPSYAQILIDRDMPNMLRMWRKRRRNREAADRRGQPANPMAPRGAKRPAG
jgi:predicted RNA methylase